LVNGVLALIQGHGMSNGFMEYLLGGKKQN